MGLKESAMIYEFAAKIKSIQNEAMLDMEMLNKAISETSKKFEKPLEIRIMLPDKQAGKAMLVKSQASVSSMPAFHDKERDEAIAAFKQYMDDIALAVEGEISKTDGFYNNTKIFSKLY